MADQVQTCYDALAAHYHLLFDDWNAAITRQAAIIGPLLEQSLPQKNQLRILDCACGIGTQAIGLAQEGHHVTGSDFSPAALERARREASARHLDIQFVLADMLDLGPFADGNFDAVVCLDNSLPHLSTVKQLRQAAMEFCRTLRPGGIFMASIRDYDRLIHERPSVHQPSFFSDGEQRRIVHQVWDWIDNLHYTFHLYITHQVSTGWQCHHYAANYRALMRNELTSAIQAAGFITTRWIFPDQSNYYQPIFMARSASPQM